MDKDFLSKKRNKNDLQEKPNMNKVVYKPNPFFDFSEHSTIQEKLNLNETFSSNKDDYKNSRLDNYQGNNNFYNRNNREIDIYQSNNYNNNYHVKRNFNNVDHHKFSKYECNSYNKNDFSKDNLNQFNSSNKKTLPIEKYRDVILNYIKNNQVLVIAGETGCGKTTQVPKYIFEDYVKRNDNSLNMIITQPRRIAAVSIAKRLSEELGVINGKEVGYHVGRSPVFDSEKTRILIVTTGIFLQRLIHEKELLNVTHVILDEVHEREIDIDFVMILIKHILKKHSNLKLILMSATISTHLFANYFSKENIEKINDLDYYRNVNVPNEKEDEQQDVSWTNFIDEKRCYDSLDNVWENTDEPDKNLNNKKYNNKPSKKLEERNENLFLRQKELNPAPILKVEEKIYPVKIEYLREIIEKYIDREFAKRLPMEFQFEKLSPRVADYIFDIAAMLIRMIHYNDNEKKFFSILVFLPGYFEIQTMSEKILTLMDEEEQDIEILQLHSGISE